jgi:hypothetical protein
MPRKPEDSLFRAGRIRAEHLTHGRAASPSHQKILEYEIAVPPWPQRGAAGQARQFASPEKS